MKRIIALVLLVSLTLSMASCHRAYTVKEKNIKIPNADVVNIDITSTEFSSVTTPEEAVTQLAVDLLKSLYKGDENILISPVSISLALGLTAGGAKGNTLLQLEKALGRGISMQAMDEFYSTLSEKLDNSEDVDISVANSVWIRNNKDMISVNDSFKKFAEDVYDGEIYSEKFDNSTVKKINGWVDEKTDGMIKEIIDEIGADTVMYLINALAFDAEWQREYTKTSDHFKFTNTAGESETVTGLFSTESKYIEDENTTGFIKYYKGGEYAFALLLPNSEIHINDYIASLNGEKLKGLLDSKRDISVIAKMPKFSYEYSAQINDSLKEMGITDAFSDSKADLTGIGTSNMGNLYVNRVLHKTFIEVAEKGTRAAAVTAVEVNTESAEMPPKEQKYVTANRPFVYAIIDNESNTPIFLGALLSTK